jgi:adenosylhomocysteine nucleosidase
MALTRTAIVAAMPGELKPLVRGWRHERRNRVHLWRWSSGQVEWVAACSGVGQNAAARALAEIERDGPVAQVLSVGWAGALKNWFKPGEAYRVVGVVDLPTNTRLGTAPFGAGRSGATQSKSDQGKPGQDKSGQGNASQGNRDIWLATSTAVILQKEKQRIAVDYYADLVDMEAIAIARVAKARGVAFHCIKGVSDGADDVLPDFNPFLTPDGEFKRLKFILFALFHPGYWQALKQMGENSKQAAQRIAEQVLDLLDPEGNIRKQNGYSNISG